MFDEEDKVILKALIYPSERESGINVDDAFGIFIGYEIDINEETKNCTNDEFFDVIKEKIIKQLEKINEKIFNYIEDYNLNGHTIYVYILPFTDIVDNRTSILKRVLSLVVFLIGYLMKLMNMTI